MRNSDLELVAIFGIFLDFSSLTASNSQELLKGALLLFLLFYDAKMLLKVFKQVQAEPKNYYGCQNRVLRGLTKDFTEMFGLLGLYGFLWFLMCNSFLQISTVIPSPSRCIEFT